MQTTSQETQALTAANAGFSIDRREVQALHNRAKQLVLTMGWLGKAQELRFAQGALGAYAGLLSSQGHEFLAARDASMGGYNPLAGFEAAWAALPESAKNYSLAQVQEFLRLHAVELSGDAIANMQVNSVEGLKDSEVATVDLQDEHDAARAQVGDGSSLHTVTPNVVEPTIVCEGGAA